MARHREITTWNLSRARHRAPGSVELFVQRGESATVSGVGGCPPAFGLTQTVPLTFDRSVVFLYFNLRLYYAEI